MENSKIEWTDHTFNPWIGCTKVSDGCKHCYAESLMDKRFNKVRWGPQGTRQRTSAENWDKPVTWNKQAQKLGIRYRVFCASLADVFEDNPQVVEWRADLFRLIGQTSSLDWLLLTKRPENVNRMVADYAGDCQWLRWNGVHERHNIWLGTSVENQEQADKRIQELMYIPARVRFLSMEPLLGPVDVAGWTPALSWVIVGGESGPEARPMRTEWAMRIREDCADANVPFFMKQLGGHPNKRHDLVDFPPELQVRQFPSA